MQSNKEYLAQELARELTRRGLTLAVAESCTGGLLSATITEVAGASKFYKGGVCSYCNEIKHRVLGVRKQTLEQYTAVSEQTAAEMAQGCAALFAVDIAASVTGYAGPDGGEDGTPVGTIYLGITFCGKTQVTRILEPTGRQNARECACRTVFQRILDELQEMN